MTQLTGIPTHWQRKRLADVCLHILGGGTPTTSNPEFWDGTIPWISSADVHGLKDIRPRRTITEKGLKESTTNLLPEGGIVVVTRVGLGKIAIAPYDLSFSQDSQGLILDEKVILRSYALLCLSRAVQIFKRESRGTTISGVTKKQLNDVCVPLPPIDEQERIVAKIEELFSELDAGVENLKKAQVQLKTYRQAVLKSAFEAKLTNKNLPDGNLPKGWKKMTIGDIVYDVEYGSAAKSKKIGKVPVLRMGNIQNGSFDWSDLVFTDDADEIEKYLLKKDDVLFNRTNSPEWVGKTALFKGERKAVFAGYLIRLNRIETLIDARYLTYFLNSHDAKLYGNSVKTFGVNQANINGTKLKSYPINICPLEEQQRIVEEIESRLSVCDKLEDTIAASLKQSDALRQSILKQAFEGKLVPPVVESNKRKPNEQFERIRILAFILQYLSSKGFHPKQMATAKYVYLVEKVFGVPIYKEYRRLHLGPYSPEIKKNIFNKTYFSHTNNGIDVLKEDTLFKYPVPNKQIIETAIDEIAATFSRYSVLERSHKVELLATVCKVIEDIGSTELAAIRQSMKEWPIELDGSKFKNKADKFDELETERCLNFVLKKEWDKNLIDSHGSNN